MNEKAEIGVSISSDTIAVNAKGDSATRIGNSIADAIRFFSSPMGLVADEVDRFRIFRQVAFEQTILKAHNIAIERKIKTSEAPLKFIAQWSEAASLEDMDDAENLSDYWANLLVSEVDGSEPNSLIYIDILKKLNRAHVDFLRQMLGETFPSAVGNPSILFGRRNIEYLLKEPFLVGSDGAFSKFPEDKMMEQISEINLTPGVELLVVSHDPVIHRTLHSNFRFEWIREEDADCEGDQPDLIFSSLAALNLVERCSGTVQILPGQTLKYIASILTPLGWDFLRACSTDL